MIEWTSSGRSTCVALLAALALGCATEPPRAEVGGGTSGFTPIADGGDVPLVEGAQGGHHLTLGVRAQGLDPDGATLTIRTSPQPEGRPRQTRVWTIDLVERDRWHVAEELRAVLRRVLDRGLPWDQVEIVTPDPAAYGSTLHELASRLGIPVTYAVGLPVERTRPGRVVRTYLDWIAEGFQAAPIRRLLEAGDLRPGSGRGEHAPADLARRFRRLRIGWGRKRYRTQIRGALAALDEQTPGPYEDEARFRRRVARARSELRALRNILFPALRATPSVPDRRGEAGRPVSPSELATGLRAFLRKVAPGDGADAAALEQLQGVLERVEVSLRRRTDFQAAVTILRRHLEIRVRAPEPAPR